MSKYTLQLLNDYCKTNNIILLKNYNNEKIGCETKIQGKCKSEGCIEVFEKCFKYLIKNGSLCIRCNKIKSNKLQNNISYDYNLLKLHIEINSLCNDYSNTIISRDTIIHFKCTNCNIETTKKLRQITISGSYCKKCTEYNRQEKVMQSNLENYGVENVFQSEEIKDKIKETNLERYGVEYATQSELIQSKTKETNLEKYGCEYPLQNSEILLKLQTTNLERYGNICSAQNSEIKEKIKETNLERYGCEYATQSELIKSKTKETNLEKYGCEYTFQSEKIKEKIKETNLGRYGCEYATQSELIQSKTKETNLQNYGVEHPMQNASYAYNIFKNAFKLKDYILPSGNIIKIQGYEHYALDELLQIETIDETYIINGVSNVPEIWYEDKNNKQHRHYVDIFIPSQNRMIEVKSTWTAKTGKDYIFLKQEAGKKAGYLYEIWVYNEKGKKVECYI